MNHMHKAYHKLRLNLASQVSDGITEYARMVPVWSLDSEIGSVWLVA